MRLLAVFIKLFSKIFFRIESEKFIFLLRNKYIEYQSKNYSINQIAIQMLILAEDHRFFQHGGFDVIAIVRAIVKRIFLRKLEGGSTIEQQLVRTITGDYRKVITRKLREICLASLISDVIEKDCIPEFYLSVAYYGYNMVGYEKVLIKLNLVKTPLAIADNAAIIARLKYPEPSILTIKRRNQIRQRSNHIIQLFNMRNDKNKYLVSDLHQ